MKLKILWIQDQKILVPQICGELDHKKSAVLTFIFDFMKGFLTLFISNKLFGSIFNDLVIFIIIGHCFSIFIKFKGGKGVAAFLGILLFLQAKLFLITVTVWGLVFILKKTSSIAALSSIVITFITNIVLFESEISLLI